MRILIFNWKDLKHPRAGGAEVFVHEVAKRWVEWGNPVTLFCARPANLPSMSIDEGVQVRRSGSRYSVYGEAKAFYLESEGKFDAILDVVNTRPFMAPLFAGSTPVMALIFQVCREIWWHEFPFPLAALGRFVLEPRWLARYAAVPVATISQSSRDSLVGYGIRHASVVPTGLSSPRSLPSGQVKEKDPTMIFVARLSSSKRPQQAVSVLSHVRKTFPRAQLWLVGSGPLEAELRRSAAPGLTVFGRVDEAKKFELLARAHVLIATSVREGWGINVAEANSVGTPTVCYRVPGLIDSVQFFKTGTLTDCSPEALAKGVVDFLNKGEGGPPLVAAPTWDQTAERLFRELTDVTEQKGVG